MNFDDLIPPEGGSKVSFDDLVPAKPAEQKFGLGDTWPARLAKTLFSAVTLPGDVAKGNVSMVGEDGGTNPDIIKRSAELAIVASPLSPAARIGAGWMGALKTKDGPAPTQEALATAAGSGYDKARALGVELHPRSLVDLSERINSALTDIGINGELAPKTFGILSRIKEAPADSVVTVPNLETVRRAFGHAAGDFSNPTEQLAAGRAKRDLADYLAAIPDKDVVRGPAAEASDLIKNANANYAASKRSEQISEALKKAELQTSATHSGRNLDNKTRQSFVKLLTNDKASAGFTQSELDAAESIIKGSNTADLMRSAGNFLGGGGGLGMLHGSSIGAAGGATLAGPLGAAVGATTVPALGYMLKKGADASTLNKVQAFQEMVRRRSPLGESMPETVSAAMTPQQAIMTRLIAGGFVPRISAQNE
jgi:hypothetical protein